MPRAFSRSCFPTSHEHEKTSRCYRYRRDRWIVVQSAAESVYKLVGVRRGVAKVGHKWGNFGLYWCGSKIVGSAPIEKPFHRVANGRDGYTMVPFSSPRRKFRLDRIGIWNRTIAQYMRHWDVRRSMSPESYRQRRCICKRARMIYRSPRQPRLTYWPFFSVS